MSPGTGKTHVKVEIGGGRILTGEAELRGRSSIATGRIGGGELGHHNLPHRVPSHADGGYEKPRREGCAPEDLTDGFDEIITATAEITVAVIIEGHSRTDAVCKFPGRFRRRRRPPEVGADG